MSPLPEFRVSSGCPAFTCVGLDYAGPIFSTVGRSLAKRYLCVLTCMATRAIHFEIAHLLNTQSCLHALQRFIDRRGPPRDVYLDNGSEKKLFRSGTSLSSTKLCARKEFRVTLILQLPATKGVSGRESFVLYDAGERVLTDEYLLTFFTEVKHILNDRPILAVSSDSRDLKALTPNSLLLGSINSVVLPNVFIKAEGYRNSWKLVH